MQLCNRRAGKRLAWFGGFLLVFLLACWFAMIRMPLRSFSGPLPPLTTNEQAVSAALRRDLEKIGGEIGERNVYIARGLRASANYIESELAAVGLKMARQSFTVLGEKCENLIVEIPGGARAEEIVVLGAHYDSVQGAPGANDNGSGTVATLALARQFAASKPARTLRFVWFVNEEPPFFQTEQMGSLVYARSCRASNDHIVAMVSLETMGFYSDTDTSQRYPFPVGMFYPKRGNFIAFVGKTTQAGLVRQCLRTFRETTQFPSEGAALPSKIPGVDWSDHWAFWQVGYPALEVTDTAIFRYQHYHTLEDTPDKIDYDRMARVVTGLEKVVGELVGR